MGINLKRTIATGLLVIAGVIGVVAPARATPAHGQALGRPLIRVGYFPNITHAQAVLGFGAGLFARDLPGADVRGTVFNAGPDELNALFAGTIDIGYIGPGPAINGYIRSHGQLTIVAGAASGGTVLVASKSSGITSVAGLAGKKVAVPQLGNSQDIILRALLRSAGLAPSESGGTVRVIAVQNPDTLALLRRGDVDAALVPEPWGSRLIAQAHAHVVLDWNQIYGGAIPATVVVASTPFFKAHPDLVVRFLRAHVQVTGVLAHAARVQAALNEQIKALTGKALPRGVLMASLTKTRFTSALDTRALNRFAQFSADAGYISAHARLEGLVNVWPLAHLHDLSIK